VLRTPVELTGANVAYTVDIGDDENLVRTRPIKPSFIQGFHRDQLYLISRLVTPDSFAH